MDVSLFASSCIQFFFLLCAFIFLSFKDMESAIKTVVTTYLSSARGKDSLDSKSFKKMIQKQLGGIMEDTNSNSAIKTMQEQLDENKDGKVSFQEYLSLIGYLANSLSQSKTESNAAAS
ncbi:protein S100-A13 [Xenentodon cancila]